MMQAIHFFLTGGTIGAQAYDTPPEKVQFSTLESDIETNRVAREVRAMPHGDRCIFHLMPQMDSKDIGEQDLRSIVDAIRGATITRAIITIGTDRMAEHARFLSAMLTNYVAEHRAIVLLTGSMKPLANGPKSDGFENLRNALNGIDKATPGVHIAMHGQFLNPARAYKDFKEKRIKERPDTP